MLKPFLLLLAILSPSAALADLASCITSVSGTQTELKYNPDDPSFSANRSYKEWMFGGRGAITCPGLITLRYLSSGLTDEQRSVFCLNYDRAQKTFSGIDIGARDAFLICKAPSKTLCQRVNASKEAALQITGLASDENGTTAGKLANAGVAAVRHGSGAMVLTGKAGLISSALGSTGTGLMTFLTAPATLTAAAVSVVAVGGAVYVCSE